MKTILSLLGRHHRKVAFALLMMFAAVFVSAALRTYYYSWPMLLQDYEFASENCRLWQSGLDEEVDENLDVPKSAYDSAIEKSVVVVTGYVDRVCGDRVVARFNYGLVIYQADDYETARSKLEKAYASCCDEHGVVRPGYQLRASDIMLLIGNAWANRGKVSEAVVAYELSLKLNPGNITATYNLEKLQDSQDGDGSSGGPASVKRI